MNLGFGYAIAVAPWQSLWKRAIRSEMAQHNTGSAVHWDPIKARAQRDGVGFLKETYLQWVESRHVRDGPSNCEVKVTRLYLHHFPKGASSKPKHFSSLQRNSALGEDWVWWQENPRDPREEGALCLMPRLGYCLKLWYVACHAMPRSILVLPSNEVEIEMAGLKTAQRHPRITWQ